MKKMRLDAILISRGSVKDNAEAFIIVTEGRVFVDGQKAVSPAQLVDLKSKMEVRGVRRFVGRGALKLEAALEKFKIDVSGQICADIGAATGGFTEVLLRDGAKKVYAIDTARGKLVPKIRNNPRVVVMEETDVRDLEKLPETIDIVTIDVSLISLRGILPHVRQFFKKDGTIIALFKPQYEARDPRLLRHGIIRNDAAREKIFSDFLQWAKDAGWRVRGTIISPIRGSRGNVEYLVWLRFFLSS